MSIKVESTRTGPSPEAVPSLSAIVPLHEFLSLDIRSLALLRVGLALCLIYDWIDRLPDLAAFYSDQGIVPRSILGGFTPPALQFYSGEVWFQGLLAGIALLFALALLVGYRTPLVTFVSWWLLISAHARNPALLQGGDMLLRLLLFWGLFLPLGACFSFDAADPDRKPRSPRVLSPGSVALVIQICLVYWFAAAWKWSPEWRSEGTAVYMALHIDHFTTRIGQWLREQPLLCQLLTYSSLYLETLGPTLLFLPFAPGLMRMLAIAAFISFHAGLAVTLELSNFPFVCMVAWLALLPTSFWDRMCAQLRTPERRGLTLIVDPFSQSGRRLACWLRTFLLLPDANLADAVDAGGQLARIRVRGGWGVVDHQGHESSRLHALIYLTSLSPVFCLFSGLLKRWPFALLADRLLHWLSGGPRERHTPDTSTPVWTPPGGLLVNSVVVLLILYAILWNVSTIDPNRQRYLFPPQMAGLGTVLSLEQGWGLFAPAPGKVHGWYQVVGKRKDGQLVDLLNGGAPPTDNKPALLSATYSNGRWRKLMMNLPGELDMVAQEAKVGESKQAAEELRQLLPEAARPIFDEWLGERADPEKAAWLEGRWRRVINQSNLVDVGYPHLLDGYCRYQLEEWNRQHPEQELSYVRLTWMKEENVPPGETPAPPVKRVFYYSPPGTRPTLP